MHRERRLLTTLTARNLTDPGPVPIRVLDSGLLMGGTFSSVSPSLFASGTKRKCAQESANTLGRHARPRSSSCVGIVRASIVPREGA